MIVSLSQAKRQLNITDNNDDDDHIQLLVDVCSELAEGYTNRMLSSGKVDLLITNKKSFYLPYGEVTEEDEAIIATVAGNPISFYFEPISQKITITDEQVLPTDEIKITYCAGYKTVPNSAKMGVLMMVASLFINREDTVVGLTVADIPLSSTKILDKIKKENI